MLLRPCRLGTDNIHYVNLVLSAEGIEGLWQRQVDAPFSRYVAGGLLVLMVGSITLREVVSLNWNLLPVKHREFIDISRRGIGL